VPKVAVLVDDAPALIEATSAKPHASPASPTKIGGTKDDEEGDLLALPYDTPKAPGLAYQPRVFQFEFGAALQGQLAEAPNGRGLVLAGFAALLFRYTQQPRIPVGVIGADGSVGALVIEAHEHQAGAELAEIIDRQLQDLPPWSSGAGRRPPPQITVALAGHTVVQASPTLPSGEPDLHLWLAQPMNRGIVTYNASLLTPETVARWLRHFDLMAEGLCRKPECPIGQLPMLAPTEIRQLLVDWRPASKPYPQRGLFHEVARHAHERPDAPAVTFRDESLSYGELDRRSNRLAHCLRGHGVRDGAPVAVCVEPSLDIAVCLLGILKAGGAFVPVDPTYPTERQAAILDDVQPKVLLRQSHLRPGLPAAQTAIVEIDASFTSGRRPGVLDDYPATLPDPHIGLDDVAFIVYTSGTTGKPKGVMMTHANLINYIRVAEERYGFSPTHVQPAMARFSFSITLFELLSPMVAGGRLIILERDHVLDFRRLLATLAESTVLHASPSLLRKLVATIREQGIDVASLDGLRHVSSGGDLVSADLMEDLKRTFRKAELFVIYGCSEIACMGCTYEIPRDRTVTRSRVGRPFPNVSLRICDGNRTLVPIGVAGEIYLGGAGLARGYLNLPELTQEKFVVIDGERYYRTGDIGRYDANGDVEMLGRSDFQIKLRGIRIELGEIESTLRRARGVREAVVAARELRGEKALVAYVVLDPTSKTTVADLRRFLHAKLPDYMIPTAFVVLEALPVNMNQKVDRRALPAPNEADLARQRTLVKARDFREQQVLKIWQKILHTSALGVEDSFFDVGGDSLLAVTLMVELERQFGRSLPLSTLLTEPTVAALARLLGDGPTHERSAVVLLRGGGQKPPIFFVHDGEGEILPYRTLAMKLADGHPVYGIQPKSRLGYPMLHSRLADVSDYYCRQILAVQPQGPYLLGGLCIGGFIAFDIASRLKKLGHTVAMVALLDVAHVKATPRSLTARRMKHFSAALKQARSASPTERALRLLRESSRRIRNVVSYELRSRLSRAHNQTRMRLFRAYLDQGWALPSFLTNIPVRVVLRFAEREYVLPEPYPGEVLLFRATQKSSAFDDTLIDDTPYIDLFEDRHLGWEGKTTQGFIPHDIPAGHSSMLQEPHVEHIARAMQSYIDRALGWCEEFGAAFKQ
jgi:amino acid adenylation domain-containing protein